LEEGEIAAIAQFEEDVQMRAEFLRRWNAVLRDGVSELQPDHVRIEVHCPGSVQAAVGDMMKSLQHPFLPIRCVHPTPMRRDHQAVPQPSASYRRSGQ